MTCAAVGVGITLTDSGPTTVDLANQASASITAEHARERSAAISRDFAAREALPVVNGRRWTTAELDLRVSPSDDAGTKGELKSLRKIGITGKNRNGFTQVVVGRKTYWVTDEYLAKKKPTDPANLPIAGKPCAGTSGVESGITRNAIRVYRAVCNNFPQITHFGGYDAHGEHRSGRALDIMISDVATGNAVAEFLRANASELNLYDVIWRQRIFTQQRGGEGWRSMPSRGSATANHFDHVHVSVY